MRTSSLGLLLASVIATGLTSCASNVGVHAADVTAAAPKATATHGPDQLAPWQSGFLDIHHINTGRGDAAFFILPDGTTMIFDAGALENDWDRNYAPLKQSPAFPDASRRPGEWIADYINQFAPPGTKRIDYAVISHFHSDHYGRIQSSSPRSAHGNWRLSGITDVAETWPLGLLIDRGYPTYDFPIPIRPARDASLANYFQFVDANVRDQRLKAAALAVGRDDQIVLKHRPSQFPEFSVRNVAANGRMWTGAADEVRPLLEAGQIVDARGTFNENPLSLVLKIEYGDFDYVTGGDLTGINEPDQPAWFNLESRIAPVIGEVDAATLNHHGNRDATNADWLRTLRPRVLIEQTWVSDQPGAEVVARLNSKNIWPEDRDIFATHIQEATQTAIGPWLTANHKSMAGHVVLRVQPEGRSYDIFILGDRRTDRPVTAHFGPYESRRN